VTVEDGRLAVAIGLAAQQSIATGRPVNLSELEGFSA
jgi:predicted dehydrogenase